MTLKEFRQSILAITREKFDEPCTHSLDLAIRRVAFKQGQLKRLIMMGQRAKFQTAQKQVAAWRRELVRLEEKRKRFSNMKAGIFPNANPARRIRASRRRAPLLVTAGIDARYVSEA